MTDLGTYAPGFNAFRRMLAAVPETSRLQIFENAANEAATYVSRGLDKVAAVDELAEMASAYGLNDPDAVQWIISRAFEKVEEIERVPEHIEEGQQPTNGHDQDALLPVEFPFPIDEQSIPVRDWIVPGLLLRKQITVLVAPSGSGKSLLTLQIGIACAQGATWSGWNPRGTSRVLIINSEDDNFEIHRRLAAAAREDAHIGFTVDQAAIRNSLALIDAGQADAVIAQFDIRKKKLIATPRFEKIVATILANQIDLVFVDPFAETFEGDENSNSELKWAGMLWREVARRTNAAVCLVHHTKKYATGMAGDVDAARGAGALIGIARIVSTLFPMTTKEAEAMGVASEQRGFFLRYDDAKANLNIVSPFARWFRKDTVTLDNKTTELPGDQVGVLVPWKPKGPSVLEAQIISFFVRIDAGETDDSGIPTGEFYTFEKGRSGDRYIASFAQEFFALEALSQAENLIATWRKAKRLQQIQYRSPKSRKTRNRAISELSPDCPKNKKQEPHDNELEASLL